VVRSNQLRRHHPGARRPSSGNGGSETSSHGQLNYTGTADLRAPNGKAGTLLLDPYSVTICDEGCGRHGSISNGVFTPTESPSYLEADILEAALARGNVLVTTGGAGSRGTDAGDINVNWQVTWNNSSTLTLSAYNNVNINAAISAANGGLALNAGNAIKRAAAVNAATFTLQNGNWNQVSWATGLSAANFQLQGGTFSGRLAAMAEANSPIRSPMCTGCRALPAAVCSLEALRWQTTSTPAGRRSGTRAQDLFRLAAAGRRLRAPSTGAGTRLRCHIRWQMPQPPTDRLSCRL
jgi:hypothetical protein